MKNLNLFFLMIAIMAMVACGKKTDVVNMIENQDQTLLSESDKKEIINSLTFRMNKYTEALNQLNSSKILRNYSTEGDFILFSDGKFNTYADMVTIAQALMTFKSISVTWDTIVIVPLTSHSALATAPFHRIISDQSGKEIKDWGTANWAWIKRNGIWFMVYGHANHYPEVAGTHDKR